MTQITSSAPPADVVVASVEHLVSAVQVAIQGAQGVLGAPPLPPVAEVPGLPADQQAAIAAALGIYQVAGEVRDFLTELVDGVTTLTSSASELAAGSEPASTPDERAAAASVLAQTGQALSVLSGGVSALGSVVDRVYSASQSASTQLGADAQAVAQGLQLDAAQAQALQQQIDQIQATINQDHQDEEIGWIAGPLGYLLAQKIGGLADNESSLQQQISDLQQAEGAESGDATALTGVTGSLATVSQSCQQMQVGTLALSQGWTALGGFVDNCQAQLTSTTEDPSPALSSDIAALVESFNRLIAEANTLQGQVSHP